MWWYILDDSLLSWLLFIMCNSPKAFEFFTALFACKKVVCLQRSIAYWLTLPHCNDYSCTTTPTLFSAFWLQNWKTRVWNEKEYTDTSGKCSWDKMAFFNIFFWHPLLVYHCNDSSVTPKISEGLLCFLVFRMAKVMARLCETSNINSLLRWIYHLLKQDI